MLKFRVSADLVARAFDKQHEPATAMPLESVIVTLEALTISEAAQKFENRANSDGYDVKSMYISRQG